MTPLVGFLQTEKKRNMLNTISSNNLVLLYCDDEFTQLSNLGKIFIYMTLTLNHKKLANAVMRVFLIHGWGSDGKSFSLLISIINLSMFSSFGKSWECHCLSSIFWSFFLECKNHVYCSLSFTPLWQALVCFWEARKCDEGPLRCCSSTTKYQYV